MEEATEEFRLFRTFFLWIGVGGAGKDELVRVCGAEGGGGGGGLSDRTVGFVGAINIYLVV